MGPTPYLTYEEEKELVKFILNCSRMGYGKTRGEVLRIVGETMKKKGRLLVGSSVSQGWWSRFKERWPELSLRKGDAFSLAREKMTSAEVFNSYFNLLEETLKKYNLIEKPAQLYNCDESGMPLEHKLPKIIAKKGAKKVRQISSGNKTQITVLACCSATGQAIPPMVIFSGKKFNHDLSKREVPGTLYGMSDSGWMDQELFFNWFANHFLKHAVSARPLLLMLDGHSSHYTLELVQEALKNEVIIFCLPPHTTADSQPLDTSCFAPLKVHWSNACRDYTFKNPGWIVSKFQFSKLFASAWSKGLTIGNITSAFRNTGIYPLNREKILQKLPIIASEDNSDHLSVNGASLNAAQACESEIEHSQPSTTIPTWSTDKAELFERRWENGYDVYSDSEYVAWLHQFHPDSSPSLSAVFSSVPPLQPTGN